MTPTNMPFEERSLRSETHKKNSRWSVLAATRFVLAICVVITHSAIVAPGYFLSRHFGGTGYPAVFGFFLVSGYSIAASLISKPNGYFFRRVRRIYPTYLCALAFTIIILLPHPLHLPLGQVLVLDNWKTILSNVFMMQGTLTQSILGDGAVWSLSVEWWCYMLAILLVRHSVKWTTVLIAMSFGSLMFYMRSNGYLVGNADMPLGLDFLLLSWAWMAGFSFYRMPTKINFSIMVLLPLMMFEVGWKLPLASIVTTTTALIIYFSNEIYIKSKKLCQILQWLGNMSYPLYLFHPPLLYILSSKGIITNGNYLILAIVIIISVGYYVACRIIDVIAGPVSILVRRGGA